MWFVDPTHDQNVDLYFNRAEMRIRDKQVDVFEQDIFDTTFFESSDEKSRSQWLSDDIMGSDRTYLSIYFRLDSRRKLYRREDYDLLTYLGDIGGLLDVILLLGWSTSTVFVSRLFQGAIVGRVYRL